VNPGSDSDSCNGYTVFKSLLPVWRELLLPLLPAPSLTL